MPKTILYPQLNRHSAKPIAGNPAPCKGWPGWALKSFKIVDIISTHNDIKDTRSRPVLLSDVRYLLNRDNSTFCWILIVLFLLDSIGVSMLACKPIAEKTKIFERF